MKTFNQFTKGTIPVPIHFKYTDSSGPLAENYKPFIPPEDHIKKLDWIGHYASHDSVNPNEHLLDEYDGPPLEPGLANDERKFLENTRIAHVLSAHNKFTEEEEASLHRYTDVATTFSSDNINPAILRNEPLDPVIDNHVNILKNAIDKNRVRHSFHVFSGLGFDPQQVMTPTKEIYSPCFLSATHDFSFAKSFAKMHDSQGQKTWKKEWEPQVAHIMCLHLQPGDPASHISRLSRFSEEQETIVKGGVRLMHHYVEDYRSWHKLTNFNSIYVGDGKQVQVASDSQKNGSKHIYRVHNMSIIGEK